MPAADPRGPARAVIDTNVCLDLFVFEDPVTQPLLDALRAGAMVALTRGDCREEWRRVLRYPRLGLSGADCERMEKAYDALFVDSMETDVHAAIHAGRAPRCTDPDDQKFLELARASAAACLITRDRALLRLDRTSRRRGLCAILTPAAWARAVRQAGPRGLAATSPRDGHAGRGGFTAPR